MNRELADNFVHVIFFEILSLNQGAISIPNLLSDKGALLCSFLRYRKCYVDG